MLRWQSLTLEIARELYRAREALAKEGRPETVPNGTVKGWSDYLEDIGLARTTAHRWLERYDPKADGQDAGEMLLNIEARIGELYDELPKAKGGLRPDGGRGRIAETDLGISSQMASKASTIHRNPAAVAAVIKEARAGQVKKARAGAGRDGGLVVSPTIRPGVIVAYRELLATCLAPASAAS